jgi:saccharopine dehydrogenase-like NADP-dependent oxidoreductase
MKQVVIIGAGKIGVTIAALLLRSGAYRVHMVDQDQARLDAVAAHPMLARSHLATTEAGRADPLALDRALHGAFAVLSAVPYHAAASIADAAARTGVHYFDLTEDVANTRHVKGLAEVASSAFVPQCGLAPGFIAIVAHDIARHFDSLDTVRMRVGALPQYPSNTLGYNLTWSTDGVINEYCEPCEAIVNGRMVEVPALEGLEAFGVDGIEYECFNTSGGLGTLCETLSGKVRTLNYKTIRYPGHAAIMKTLLQDLRLGERRALMRDIFEHALPSTMQDVVVVFVTVAGMKAGRLVQESYASRIFGQTIDGQAYSAIQLTTASGICVMLDLMAEGALPRHGFVRQEDVTLDQFLTNRFGKVYALPGSAHADHGADVIRLAVNRPGTELTDAA